MPELPEVEIVKQSLEKTVKNKRIIDVKVKNRNLRFKLNNKFEKFLKNNLITNISRKAKYLVLEVNNSKYALIHFGMSGTLHLVKGKSKSKTNLSFYHSQELPKKHNHIELMFENFKIIYNDPRRFGYIKIFYNKKILNRFLDSYGEEPLDTNFNLIFFKKNILKRDKNIKNILLDQKIISGIGNIYANEILFNAKINPKNKGKNLNSKQLNNIYKSSKIILARAIKFGGSSIRDFKNTNGSSGNFQNEFKVYNKSNEICPTKHCNNKIKKITISNRSTFYCQKCQK